MESRLLCIEFEKLIQKARKQSFTSYATTQDVRFRKELHNKVIQGKKKQISFEIQGVCRCNQKRSLKIERDLQKLDQI